LKVKPIISFIKPAPLYPKCWIDVKEKSLEGGEDQTLKTGRRRRRQTAFPARIRTMAIMAHSLRVGMGGRRDWAGSSLWGP